MSRMFLSQVELGQRSPRLSGVDWRRRPTSMQKPEYPAKNQLDAKITFYFMCVRTDVRCPCGHALDQPLRKAQRDCNAGTVRADREQCIALAR